MDGYIIINLDSDDSRDNIKYRWQIEDGEKMYDREEIEREWNVGLTILW